LQWGQRLPIERRRHEQRWGRWHRRQRRRNRISVAGKLLPGGAKWRREMVGQEIGEIEEREWQKLI